MTLDNYPPRSKSDVILLSKKCGYGNKDLRSKLGVLTDIKYRVVHEDGTGIIKGYSHDRRYPVKEFKLNIKINSGDRIIVPILEVAKIERMGSIPRKYK